MPHPEVFNLSDFGFALLTSSVLWLTLAGVSIRMLRLDFLKLEAYLRTLYDTTDRFQFSAFRVAEGLIGRSLDTVFGQSRTRQFLIALVGCTLVTSYMFITLRAEWAAHSQDIEATVRSAIKAVDLEFYDLTITESGRRALARAHNEAGTQAGTYYVYTDAEAVHIRAVTDRFRLAYYAYIREHNLSTEDMLDRFFGESYSNPFWQASRGLQLTAGMALTILSTALTDFLAIAGTLLFFRDVCAGNGRALTWLLSALACCALSLCGYVGLINGHEVALAGLLGIVILPLLCVCALGVPLAMARGITNTSLLLGLLLSVLIGVLAVTHYGGGVFSAITLSGETFRGIVSAIAHNSHREAVLIAMIGAYPLLLILSMFIATLFFKLIFEIIRGLLLAQVDGASTVAGGTMFAGFLTTIITTSTVIYWAIKVFAGPS